MTSALVFNQPWLTIRWNREHKYVDAQWRAFANSKEFRSAALKILDVLRDTKAASLVSDNRELEVVVPADQFWIRDEWTPLAVDAGLKRIAVIVAPTGLGRFASQTIVSQFPDGTFETRIFDSLAEALGWVAAPIDA